MDHEFLFSTFRREFSPFVNSKERSAYKMDFAGFVALVTDVLAIEFPFGAAVTISLGQLVIWTIALSVGTSFGTRLIRG